MNFVVICLSGKAHSGKSTAREHLIGRLSEQYKDYKFVHHSFAAKLKEIAYDLFGWDGVKDLYPEEDRGRKLLINIGTHMRDIRASVWVDFVVEKIKNDILIGNAHNKIYIIDDLRFSNELAILKNSFGNKVYWVHVSRPGVQEIDSESERGLSDCLDCDKLIINEDLNKFKIDISYACLEAIGRAKGRIHV